jgi:nitrile hydratase subunit beta
MNGAHDMGGRLGFGPVEPEANEPVFHAAWESRVYGFAGTVGAFDLWNLDEDRHACENHPPQKYVSCSYYEIWLMMFERMLVEKGVVTVQELRSGKSCNGKVTEPRLKLSEVMAAQTAFGTYTRETETKPAFAIGQHVRVRNMMTPTHTRLPGYLRGVVGEIVMIHGNHVFPDSNSLGKGEDPKWLYAVRFNAKSVWGRDTKDLIHADLWEPYLEPA